MEAPNTNHPEKGTAAGDQTGRPQWKSDASEKVAYSRPIASLTDGQEKRLDRLAKSGAWSLPVSEFVAMCEGRDPEEALRALEAQAAEDRCTREGWSEAEPIMGRSPLHPVPPFDLELLPEALRPWVADVSGRMQCPVDFLAVPCIVALSSLVGRQLAILPMANDDWPVVPNLWGGIVGRPGIMKSPALREVLAPIAAFDNEAREEHDRLKAEFEASQCVAEAKAKHAKGEIAKAVKDGNEAEAQRLARLLETEAPQPPVWRRAKVNDTTIEKLGEIIAANPNGVLWFRDELAGLFNTLERAGHESDRQFILEGWDGLNSFTFDRIGRGTVHIPANCLAILGGIQPGALARHVADATAPGKGADGLLQRLQLLVWPDPPSDEWQNRDERPDMVAKRTAFAVYERFRNLDTSGLETTDTGLPYVRFAAAAANMFAKWREHMERIVRSGQLSEAIEGHLGKYRSLVPSIALILHLADSPVGNVGPDATAKAIRWSAYLWEHALRIYGGAAGVGMDAAKCLAGKLLDGALPDGFTARDIARKNWSGLRDRADVDRALSDLEESGWLRKCEEQTGGRPKVSFLIHPEILFTPWKHGAISDETPRIGAAIPTYGTFGTGFREVPENNETPETDAEGRIVI